ncbi:MAG: alkaline phosphatase family protein [bacterium JZ-2024 1]
MTKLFVVGLDGAEFTLVERWMQEGKLPHLRRLSLEGAWGCLRSTIPPITPAAWTSFLTGKNPGKTGIYDFYQVKREEYALYYPNASYNRAETIQEILSDAGLRVGLLNVPMTYPAEAVNGYVIPGLGAPENAEEDFSYPPGFLSQVEQETGIRYRILSEPSGRRAQESQMIHKFQSLVRERQVLVEHLLKRFPTDFFVTVLSETDVFAHYFWKHMDPDHPDHTPEGAKKYGTVIQEVYRSADDLIGKWSQRCGPDDYFFVLSDHGMGPLYFAPDYLDYLAYRGWLKLRVPGTSGTQLMPLLEVLHSLWQSGRYLYAMAKRSLPWRIRNFLNRVFPRAKRTLSTNFSLLDLIDWDASKVYFCDPRNIGFLFINLKGREPRGIVSADEYELLISAIKEDLKSLRIPGTDVPLVEEVFHRSEIYSGAYASQMPDLVILWNFDATRWAKHALATGLPEAWKHLMKPLQVIPMASRILIPFSAFHTMRGILFARGPGVKAGYRVEDANIYDLMPTFLALMGVAIPEDVDGRVLSEILCPEYASALKPTYRAPRARKAPTLSPYTPEEEEALRNRLKDLGYID